MVGRRGTIGEAPERKPGVIINWTDRCATLVSASTLAPVNAMVPRRVQSAFRNATRSAFSCGASSIVNRLL